MSSLVIRDVTSSITTFSVPFTRLKLMKFGGRSTAIKLEGGSVFLCASSPCDEVTKAKLAAMGKVAYIVALDIVHMMYLADYHQAYPDALVFGPEGAREKKPEVKFAGVLGDGEVGVFGFEKEISLHFFPGHANKEIAVLHIPSKTLIEADIIFNLPASEQYSKTTESSKSIWPGTNFTKQMRPFHSDHRKVIDSVTKDKTQMKKDAKVVAGWDFDRIIPCHGDVIETKGKEAWLNCFNAYL